MSNLPSINYYSKGRTIQPIRVIENWSLCHHLACVIKYIARAGRKGPILEDLKKGEWYLMRELARYHKQFNDCHFGLIEMVPITPTDVIKDWELSPHLDKTLRALKAAKNQTLRKQLLKRALYHLRAEISTYEQKENLK